MARRNKMTFEKRRREMAKKKARAEKLERKHDRTRAEQENEIPDPLEAFKEYEAEHGTRFEEEEGDEEKTPESG